MGNFIKESMLLCDLGLFFLGQCWVDFHEGGLKEVSKEVALYKVQKIAKNTHFRV
ncbi:hypothetical protein Syun_016519 [Stephania yunnanensis]|uniref:Uncharacterized protein n=1 Tax=Stephania yunnanensis TaxID=152371 RepID=A0AAP0J508_9MAGN